MLNAPVGADERVYVSQRSFEGAILQPILRSFLSAAFAERATLGGCAGRSGAHARELVSTLSIVLSH